VASVTDFRAGFGCFVGRPNTGKSTLMNALVGTKVSITSTKPQTTRHAVRGVVNRAHGQLVLVDTPGFHRPRTLLGERLNDVVRATLADVDVIGFCIPANEKIGPGDRFIAAELAPLRAPIVAVVTKADAASRADVAAQLLTVRELGEFADIVPVSAAVGFQLDLLTDVLIAHLPEGPPLYPADVSTDEPIEQRIAEIIREAAIEQVRDELPHSIAVTVEEIEQSANLVKIFATLHLERTSQKPIVLGARGTRLKSIGTAARRQIEQLLRKRVHLDLHVAVLGEWQRDPKLLDRLGF
jgi:GTP-binding protein Era